MMSGSFDIIVGLSGGVDSAVAAYLLKRQGHRLRAVFMKNFTERINGRECPWREDRLMAYRVASFLKIPIETWDFQQEYKKTVVDYMIREYSAGRTPNPDIMCNKTIKFEAFLKRARAAGADYIATGHYAALRTDAHGVAHLLKPKDLNKDQTYFLATLKQAQLRRALFPLSALTKPEVRAMAKKIGLPNATRPDSQGICFIGPVPMNEFLKTKIKQRRGNIIDTTGIIVGEHDGVQYYTIGQRRGIRLGGGPALYVIRKDVKRNRLMVGPSKDLLLYVKDVEISAWRWLADKHSLPLKAKAKIRYRQNDQSVIILKGSAGGHMRARFARPQRAVAPGQTLAVYKGRELVASGVIL